MARLPARENCRLWLWLIHCRLTVIGVAESLEGTELADRIRRLCVELGRGELAEIIRHAGAEPLLERLLHMLAAEKADPAEAAALMDTLDEAAVQAGIDGLTRAPADTGRSPGQWAPRSTGGCVRSTGAAARD